MAKSKTNTSAIRWLYFFHAQTVSHCYAYVREIPANSTVGLRKTQKKHLRLQFLLETRCKNVTSFRQSITACD